MVEIKKKLSNPDLILGLIILFLVLFGLVICAGVFAEYSQQKFGKSTYYLFHQLIYGFLFGAVLGFLAYKTPLNLLKKWSFPLVILSLFLMILVFIPGLKLVSGGAARWINLGWFTFQPSEFLKLIFIVYSAALVSSRVAEKTKENWQLLIPFSAVLAVVVLLLFFQSDLSTLVVISVSVLTIYFFSDTPLWHNILFALTAIFIFALFIFISPYRMERVSVLLGLIKDPLGIGYQTQQVLIAIGSGQIFGLGLEPSSLSLLIPNVISDSIFAEFGRAAGFIGSIVLVLLYLFFFWRGIFLAKRTNNKFPRLLIVGLVSWITFQAFVNIGAMIKLFPLTGIPLPFISYGGSHIAVEMLAMGLLLNASRYIK